MMHPGMLDDLARFEEQKSWENQVEIRQVARSTLDDDAKVSVVTHVAPSKPRDNVVVNAHQFDSKCNQLSFAMRSDLHSTKKWTMEDVRTKSRQSRPTVERARMNVDHIFRESKSKRKSQSKRKNKKSKDSGNNNGNGKNKKNGNERKSNKQRTKPVARVDRKSTLRVIAGREMRATEKEVKEVSSMFGPCGLGTTVTRPTE